MTLGEFLRSRRAALTPEAAGIVSYGARRVPGLRREELAQLAGVSPAYYTRLEQGQSTNASPSVLDALARALELDEDERQHLHAWNDLGHRLLAGHVTGDPNLTRMLFLDPHTRELYRDWEQETARASRRCASSPAASATTGGWPS